MAQLIDIDEAELETVRRCMLHFTGADEGRPDGAVGLHCHDGRRWWIASSYSGMVAFKGGPAVAVPAIRLPGRVLGAHLDGSLPRYVPSRTEDGVYRQPAALQFGRVQVEAWPEVQEAVEWRSVLSDVEPTFGGDQRGR